MVWVVVFEVDGVEDELLVPVIDAVRVWDGVALNVPDTLGVCVRVPVPLPLRVSVWLGVALCVGVLAGLGVDEELGVIVDDGVCVSDGDCVCVTLGDNV